MVHRIAIATGKGGVGKTSLASSLAGTFARFGHTTVLVELDPQGDLADDFGVRDHKRNDEGEAVLNALTRGKPLKKLIEARPQLHYAAGGPALTQAALDASANNGGWDGLTLNLRNSLEHLERDADVIIIDTPPSIESLQHAALCAADWLLIPTAADISSIRALLAITSRLLEARDINPELAYLGVALWNVPQAASRIRAQVREDLDQVVGSVVPLFETTIRSAFATAVECRRRGMLPIELADAAADAEPFWQALAAGRTPERVPTSAQALAGDYALLANEVLQRIKLGERHHE